VIEENGIKIGYDANDIIRAWEVETKGKLILKNNSKNYAYNLQLLNATEIFDWFEPLPKLSSLAPNESLGNVLWSHSFAETTTNLVHACLRLSMLNFLFVIRVYE